MGKTVNLQARLSKYLNEKYLVKIKGSMAICAALALYSVANFEFYVLEIVNSNKTANSEKDKMAEKIELTLKEHYWWETVKPSYNIQKILEPFTGANHYRYGKKVSDETKKRISETLKGRKMSLLERENHSLGNTKKYIIDCYDYYNHNLVSSFVGQNKMAKLTGLSTATIARCLADKNKPYKGFYENKPIIWSLVRRK